jgi:hypothetical protein
MASPAQAEAHAGRSSAPLAASPSRALLTPLRRASQALLLLKQEVELCRLQADIGKRVEEKISKDQRRYFLMEQVGRGSGGSSEGGGQRI